MVKNTLHPVGSGGCGTYCTTLCSCKKKKVHLWNNTNQTQTHTHTHQQQRAFVIQQQPAVIDWSICLCVAYKWATWYSALFFWNQLRQRCCVSACRTRALFLPCSLLLFCSNECERKREQDGERTQREERLLCLCDSLFNCVRVQHTRVCIMTPAAIARRCQAY